MVHIMSVGSEWPINCPSTATCLAGPATDAYNNRPMDRRLDSLTCQNGAIS